MFYSRYIMVNNIKTHYLEAGSGYPVIMLHSGEYGANARNSWEYNIDALAQYFRVYAIDMLGYGFTDKLFSFDNMNLMRINHIKNFLKVLCIKEASFIGNSLGGGLILNVAAQKDPQWPIKKIITISGGGPNNPDSHEIMNNYDCSFDYMEKIHDTIFYNKQFKTSDYINKRYKSSFISGHWEALSAARLKSPVAKKGKLRIPDYSIIERPVLVVAGKQDTLKYPDYAKTLNKQLKYSQLEMFDNCGHCAHIEYADQFNDIAINFLLED